MNIISAEFNVNFMSNIEAMLRAAEGMVVCFFKDLQFKNRFIPKNVNVILLGLFLGCTESPGKGRTF